RLRGSDCGVTFVSPNMLCHGCDAGPGRVSWSLKLPLSRVKPRYHWSGACLSCATRRHCVTSVTNHPSLDAAPTATPRLMRAFCGSLSFLRPAPTALGSWHDVPRLP